MTAKLTITEIADRIDAHLKRIEADPKLNPARNTGGMNIRSFSGPRCYRSGGGVVITYQSWTARGGGGGSRTPRDQAERYLAALDAGFAGRHTSPDLAKFVPPAPKPPSPGMSM